MLSRRTKYSYSFGTVGRDMSYNLFSGFFMTYVLFTKTLTSAQFAVLSVIIIICRVWDGLNDPIMGVIVENTRSRLGKFKPWILSGALFNGIVLIFAFTGRATGWGFVVYFTVMYLLWDLTFTMNDISYWSMLPALTSDEGERNSVTSLANLCAGIGEGLAGAFIPMLTAGNLAIGGNAVKAYAVVTVLIVTAYYACTCLTFFGVEGRPGQMREKGEKMKGLGTMFKILFHNDQLLWVALAFVLYNVGNVLWTGIITMYIYFSFGYQGALVTVFTLVSGVIAMPIYLFYPRIAKHWNRATLLRFGIVIIIAGYVLIALTGLVWPTSFPLLVVFTMLTAFGQGFFYLILYLNITNTVEYNEWKTGNRDEGIIFSVRPFMAKLGSALQQLVIMIVYLAVGVLTFTNQISDVESRSSRGLLTAAAKAQEIQGIIAQVSDAAKNEMRIAVCAASIVLLLAAYFIVTRKFKIDEKFYQKMLEEIKARRGK
jgi:melibiose permease/lactose/raffinose/galactose permease